MPSGIRTFYNCPNANLVFEWTTGNFINNSNIDLPKSMAIACHQPSRHRTTEAFRLEGRCVRHGAERHKISALLQKRTTHQFQRISHCFFGLRFRCLKYNAMAIVDYRSMTIFQILFWHGKMQWKTLEPMRMARSAIVPRCFHSIFPTFNSTFPQPERHMSSPSSLVDLHTCLSRKPLHETVN